MFSFQIYENLFTALLPHFSVVQCTFFILVFCVQIGLQTNKSNTAENYEYVERRKKVGNSKFNGYGL